MPVLPATVIPSICAPVPVPLSTAYGRWLLAELERQEGDASLMDQDILSEETTREMFEEMYSLGTSLSVAEHERAILDICGGEITGVIDAFNSAYFHRSPPPLCAEV